MRIESKTFEELDEALRIMARKMRRDYYAPEDIYQDGWVKILKFTNNREDFDIENSIGYLMNLVKNMVYDRDHYIARRKYSGEYFNSLDNEDNQAPGSVYYETAISDSKKAYDAVNNSIEEIIDLFPLGSKERHLMQLFALYTSDNPNDKNMFDKIFGNGKHYQDRIAQELGYKNSTSSGYRNLRSKVRSKIARKYL